MNNTINSENKKLIDELITTYQSQKGGLLPLLHAIQDKLGFIPPEHVVDIAKGLNVSRAEVHGVITYYHYFRTKPPGKHMLQVCRAESCQSCGADELLALAEKTLGCQSHETNKNGSVTLEPVYCLGLCASSPAIQVDDQLYGRVTADQLKKIIAGLEVGQ